jgi:hypothetical protein
MRFCLEISAGCATGSGPVACVPTPESRRVLIGMGSAITHRASRNPPGTVILGERSAPHRDRRERPRRGGARRQGCGPRRAASGRSPTTPTPPPITPPPSPCRSTAPALPPSGRPAIPGHNDHLRRLRLPGARLTVPTECHVPNNTVGHVASHQDLAPTKRRPPRVMSTLAYRLLMLTETHCGGFRCR